MRPRIFISYSSKDTQFTRKLVHDLQLSKAFDIWQDNMNLRSNALLKETIKQGIQVESQIALFYLSEDALSSPWVRDELNWAREKPQGLIFYVVDRDSTREKLKEWADLPAARILALNDDEYHVPLLELTNSMLAAFYTDYYSGVNTHSVLEASYEKGIHQIKFGAFTKEDDIRMERLIRSSKHIKLMMLNGSFFVQRFKPTLEQFAKVEGSKIDLLLADEKSEFYHENSVMVSSVYKDGPSKEDNQELVNRAINRIKGIFEECPEKLRVRKFNTEFRLPIIIFDNKTVHLTLNLPPSESINGMTFELKSEFPDRFNPVTAQENQVSLYAADCIRHFDKVFERAKVILGPSDD